MKRYTSLLLILLSAGCIDPINLNVPGGGGVLVVDGWITDQPGPYTIKLSRSIAYNNEKPLKVFSVPEIKAKLSVVDNAGNTEVLTESAPGTYRTNTMRGQVGRSYQLFIETFSGSKYHSTKDEMKPVPGIDELQYEFQVTETLYTNASGSSKVKRLEAFAIYAVVTDPAATDNFYRWQVDGIFEYFASNDTPPDTRWNHCWAPLTRLESKLLLATDTYTDGKQFRQYLANVPYDRPTFFLVKVRQQSLSEPAHSFMKKVSIQQTSTGTLFDPPSTPIAGNISNDNGSDETVLGYFGASSIALSSLLINRIAASNYKGPSTYILPKVGDCLRQEPNATNVKPDGF